MDLHFNATQNIIYLVKILLIIIFIMYFTCFTDISHAFNTFF